MDTLSAEIGYVIRRHRLAAWLSQEALAERAKVPGTHIGFLEPGERSPSLDGLSCIGDALAIPTSQLVAEAERLDLDAGMPGRA